ncbi:3-hydroxy-3-methylglutaryl-coenzyme A reductase [Scopulibacillus darangshiensis]|uniref:3-hydroxy-3-methylglutaryl coenzyme A reductase n=1 Tax=Scopulibacillus darangshiensis TaxID=442528 RepID=A0A4R2P045_9BACL|nr:hydroxymethylglutaryl-CoA reductase, degradative [Scopulibacillus darangshiensis]TCP27837.1 3-hydroxy-3-methylglutaryl-coenzyme A reductase [Scopulibacillus darangshiensis]
MTSTTRIPGFYNLAPNERLDLIADVSSLNQDEKKLLSGLSPLSVKIADRMIENAIGFIPIPLGIAVNFKINGKDTFVPMATEEPSVVAAASHAAKLAHNTGGFVTSQSSSIMRGQIQVLNVPDPFHAMTCIYENKTKILEFCNEKDPTLVSLGGGAKDIEVNVIQSSGKPMVILHLLVDTKDAMGANAVNTMAESLAPMIESITKGKVNLRIISNLADKRLVRVRALFKKETVGGPDVVNNIISAYELAEVDPYRAATHNKGIMNGISAVVLATGNDTRAIEAGAHAYAARTGRYRSLSHWEANKEGDLVGSMEIPMAVGTIGGGTKSNPIASLALKILNVHTAEELSGVIAATGLAQNFAGLKALSTEGIQKGHMALHARNLATMAGAEDSIIDDIVQQAVREKDVRYDRILEIKNTIMQGE